MTSSASLHAAAQLDEFHAPETCGRIPVWRRRGARRGNPTVSHYLFEEDSQPHVTSDPRGLRERLPRQRKHPR
jgi:hypothetical protein